MIGKINIKALGLSLGIIWALGVFLLGFVSAFGYGVELVELLSKIYIGYDSTFIGSLIGVLWAFVDAFIGGVIVGWLYNRFAFPQKKIQKPQNQDPSVPTIRLDGQ